MASDAVFKVLNALHKGTVKLTGGRLGWQGGGMPMLELTTTGRKSGQPRTVMLSTPLEEGDTIVLVASRGGGEQNPAWFLNLVANREVQVSYKGAPARTMKARVATPEERERLWARIVADHPHYGGYQKKSTRQIPVVLLNPAG
ncbi:MAG TPA: nitroreductase/quinone reductase family protein [Acidimicrobiales bacterium]|nr:nitroreductase/quinone reductase family protein [Acidimicrobiales bacterium]